MHPEPISYLKGTSMNNLAIEYLKKRCLELWNHSENSVSSESLKRHKEFGEVCRELENNGIDYKRVIDPEDKYYWASEDPFYYYRLTGEKPPKEVLKLNDSLSAKYRYLT